MITITTIIINFITITCTPAKQDNVFISIHPCISLSLHTTEKKLLMTNWCNLVGMCYSEPRSDYFVDTLPRALDF